MGQMLPTILARSPPAAARRCVRTASTQFTRALPAGVQILSLFQRNPHLLDRVAAVLGAAPYPRGSSRPASRGAGRPALAGERSGAFAPAPSPAAGCARAGRRDRNHSADRARGGLQHLGRHDGGPAQRGRGRPASDATGRFRARSAAAAGCLRIFRSASAGCAEAGWSWLRSAKRAGREMMAGSDLDLMLVYDHPREVIESRGRTPDSGQPMVRARGSRLYRRADWTRRGWAALCGRHAPAPVGQ